jgi:hypothetical protein
MRIATLGWSIPGGFKHHIATLGWGLPVAPPGPTQGIDLTLGTTAAVTGGTTFVDATNGTTFRET